MYHHEIRVFLSRKSQTAKMECMTTFSICEDAELKEAFRFKKYYY